MEGTRHFKVRKASVGAGPATSHSIPPRLLGPWSRQVCLPLLPSPSDSGLGALVLLLIRRGCGGRALLHGTLRGGRGRRALPHIHGAVLGRARTRGGLRINLLRRSPGRPLSTFASDPAEACRPPSLPRSLLLLLRGSRHGGFPGEGGGARGCFSRTGKQTTSTPPLASSEALARAGEVSGRRSIVFQLPATRHRGDQQGT